MDQRGGPPRTGAAAAPLARAAWSVTGLTAAAPGLLLLSNAERRLPQAAGTALLVAGAVAVLISAACTRMSARALRLATAVVVLLCVAAPVLLDLDGRVSPGGWVTFGGTAGVFAVLAAALTTRVRARPTRR